MLLTAELDRLTAFHDTPPCVLRAGGPGPLEMELEMQNRMVDHLLTGPAEAISGLIMESWPIPDSALLE